MKKKKKEESFIVSVVQAAQTLTLRVLLDLRVVKLHNEGALIVFFLNCPSSLLV